MRGSILSLIVRVRVFHTAGTPGEYVDGFGVKKVLEFWQKYFRNINFVGLDTSIETSRAGKWDLHEGYGGSNLGEKRFQLFQLL
jgi:hypothetical protein